MKKTYNLERFVSAQEYNYASALNEIKAGMKRTHWIWYIFPQLKGLGHSRKALYYGIEDIEEAKLYLENPILGARLLEITEALTQLQESDPSEVMGGDVDSAKLKSCMTLFAYISESGSIFHRVLKKFFNGETDSRTTYMLEGNHLA